MERRQVIKKLTGLAALAFLPKQHLYALQHKKPIHIVGLGSAGTKVMMLCQKIGLGDKYTAITASSECEHPDIQVVHYKHKLTQRERMFQELYNPHTIVPFILPDEVKKVFNDDHRFVLVGGLGGYTATHMSLSIIPLLLEQRRDFKAIFSLPFIFQGMKTGNFANKVVDQWGDLSHIRYFQSDIIREKYGNLSIKAAFEKLDEELLEIYRRNRWM